MCKKIRGQGYSRFFFSIVLFLVVHIHSFSQNGINLLTFDWKNKVYSDHVGDEAAHFINFSLTEFDQSSSISITSKSYFSVFMNSQFFQTVQSGDTIFINSKLILEPKLVTIYAKNSLETVHIQPLKNKKSKGEIADFKLSKVPFLEIKHNLFVAKTRYLIGVIVLISILAILNTSISSFSSYFSGIFKLGNFSSRGSLLRKDGVLVVFISILLIVSLVFIFTPFYAIFDGKSDLEIVFLSRAIVFLVVISIVNIILKNLIAPVFDISKLAKIYAIELVFIVMILIIFLIPLYVFVFNPYFKTLYFQTLNLSTILIAIYSILIANEIYFFYGRHTVRKMYIIAYICICDVLPFMISLKFLKELQYL